MTDPANIIKLPTKRIRPINRPSGRKPMRIGGVLLKEVPYKDEWRIQATWRDPSKVKPRGKKWFKNWRAAEQFANQESKRLDVIKERSVGRFTGSDACDSYLKRCNQRVKNGSLTLDTFAAYERDVEKVIRPQFGDVALAAITSLNVEDWAIELSARFSNHTMARTMIRLNEVLDHAVNRDMLHVNPLRVKKVKLGLKYKKRADIPDRSDLEALRVYLNDPRPAHNNRLKWSCLRVLVLLGASCGLRAGEVAGLRWDSIDPVTGEIEVKESIAQKQGRKGPKTEAGYRKIPLSPRAREILEEHAVIYKEIWGKPVGSVLRSRDMDYLRPHMVTAWFTEVMNECGLVKDPNSKPNAQGNRIPKFSFHALRHWCASHWIKATGGDVQQVSKWLGHKNASMTLDIYGHCLDDPEARAKMERIPDWLNPLVPLDAPVQPRLRLSPPEEPPMEVLPPPVSAMPMPISIPDIAKPWLRSFLEMLWQGTPMSEAYRRIADQVEPHVMPTGGIRNRPAFGQNRVLAELARLKLPTPKEIVARWRDERIIQVYENDPRHPTIDIARMTGTSKSVVHRALKSRGLRVHNEGPNNLLKWREEQRLAKQGKTPPQHKKQLKLL